MPEPKTSIVATEVRGSFGDKSREEVRKEVKRMKQRLAEQKEPISIDVMTGRIEHVTYFDCCSQLKELLDASRAPLKYSTTLLFGEKANISEH